MRLSESTKTIVNGNIELIKYCKSCGIDLNKLYACNIEHMGNHFVYGLSKNNLHKSKNELPLDIDIESQPDIVLIMTVEDGKLSFETTSATKRVLAI